MSTASASTETTALATSRAGAYRRVYVWELPVRLFHWGNAVCIVLLAVTGFAIGRPVAITYSSEAYQQYWFGTVRFIHFVTAFVFVFTFVFRIYWGFVGNRYARWSNFIIHKGSQVRELVHTVKVDVLQTTPSGRISVGHNALACVSYFVFFLVCVFQAMTGFALYSAMSTSFLPGLFDWVVPFMGSDFAVRQWHHVAMWFFVIFAMIHVYLVFYHDYVEGRGTTSSIVGGWKFVREERVE